MIQKEDSEYQCQYHHGNLNVEQIFGRETTAEEDVCEWEIEQHDSAGVYLIEPDVALSLCRSPQRPGEGINEAEDNDKHTEAAAFGRQIAEPKAQDILHIEYQRNSYTQEQKEGEFGNAKHEVLELVGLSCGVKLVDLWIGCYHNVPDKTENGILHLVAYAHGGVERDTIEHIQYDVGALLIVYVGDGAENIPARE